MTEQNPIEFSILCPTRGRASQAARMIRSVFDTADPGRVEVLLYIDSDDPTLPEYSKSLAPLEKQNVRICIGPPMSVSKSWNIIAERSVGNVLITGNDDIVYRTPGWDEILADEVKRFPDQVYCMWFDDGINHESHCAFPMVSRLWYETLGYFMPGIFEFIYNDTWLMDVGRRAGRLHYVPAVLAEHVHFSVNKSEFDETYSRNRQGQVERDKELFDAAVSRRQADADKLKALIRTTPSSQMLAPMVESGPAQPTLKQSTPDVIQPLSDFMDVERAISSSSNDAPPVQRRIDVGRPLAKPAGQPGTRHRMETSTARNTVPMKIGFMGLGKLGLPCALAIEKQGHSVLGHDINPAVDEILKSRILPYKEIGADELLAETEIRNVSVAELVGHADIIFVPIQTPHDQQYEGITRVPDHRKDFDYTFLEQGIAALSAEAQRQQKPTILSVISTVLPGTIEGHVQALLNPYVRLCYNPFFIAMGTTINDFLDPEFILLGVDDADAAARVEQFYASVTEAPVYRTAVKNAELIKVAYNTFIGMKIVFANTMMEICHKTDTSVDAVMGAIKRADRRLISTRYLDAGMGDGGGCHPRDNIAMSHLARELDLSYDFFDALMTARENQTDWLADLMEMHDLPKVILGKAFKPETSLVAGSPSILLKNLLEERGHSVTLYDPHIDAVCPEFGPSVFLIGTKHPEFEHFNFPVGSVVLDPWRYVAAQAGICVIPVGGDSGQRLNNIDAPHFHSLSQRRAAQQRDVTLD